MVVRVWLGSMYTFATIKSHVVEPSLATLGGIGGRSLQWILSTLSGALVVPIGCIVVHNNCQCWVDALPYVSPRHEVYVWRVVPQV